MSAGVNRPPALIFGVPIADLTMPETLALIADLVEAGRRTRSTSQVATVNVDFLVNSLEDESIARILRGAEVCLADGMPVVWGLRLLGTPLRGRVAGADLVPLLIEASQSTHHHVHVFGSSPDVARRAEAELRSRYPDARFSVDPGPMITDVDRLDDSVLASIEAVDPDILCVALGNPKQERFIRTHRDRLRTPVMIGVGGSLDFVAGKRKRAPRWLQALGLEWTVRAVQEPRRLGRRYAHDLRVFAPALSSAYRARRSRRDAPGLRLDVSDRSVTAAAADGTLPSVAEWAEAALLVRGGRPLHLRFTAEATVRDEAAAQIVGLVRAAQQSGTAITVDDPGRGARQDLIRLGIPPEVFGAA